VLGVEICTIMLSIEDLWNIPVVIQESSTVNNYVFSLNFLLRHGM
jgi:hypothetical protein